MDDNDDVRMTAFQEYLLGEYAKFAERRKKIRPSMNEFGRWLGVKVTSLDHWMNGNRVPDLANAITLSERLGPRVFDVLGYPPMFRITDPKLRYVILNWEELTDEQRGRIDDVITGAAKNE